MTVTFQGLLDSRLRGNDASGTNVAFFNILLEGGWMEVLGKQKEDQGRVGANELEVRLLFNKADLGGFQDFAGHFMDCPLAERVRETGPVHLDLFYLQGYHRSASIILYWAFIVSLDAEIAHATPDLERSFGGSHSVDLNRTRGD
jgi:hypothetical protein